MATLELNNLWNSKSMDMYTAKGSVNEIQGNISFLQGEWRENSSAKNISDLERKPTGKQNLHATKIEHHTGQRHLTSNRKIKFKNCYC